ncbi:hypothetical protein OG819_42410 [Streptomyces sp. NBC_01549]|uniref:hypothetical protein n=1 Tax=Streptomyces sp. NBC_01549 TaxID=2975874 RepID=UPI00224FF94D|nr:hypothetical protein [Streptomyces sp. NBC_01549]MCX4596069.1 hypothetical protein [Streptomyces sp. NBC_01549]
MTTARELVVVDGRVLLRACSLYKGHACAVIEQHHLAPKSWWLAAGKAIDTPLVGICPNCHYGAHAALDGLIAGRDVSALPPRVVALARQGLAIAAAHGLTPAPTL